MRKKYYIFVLTFLCMLCGQMGYGQDNYGGEDDDEDFSECSNENTYLDYSDDCYDVYVTTVETYYCSSGEQISEDYYETYELKECGTVDCNGDLNGNAYDSECGCIGGNTGIDECPEEQDCNGDPGGSAYYDSCGCIGGNTGIDECDEEEIPIEDNPTPPNTDCTKPCTSAQKSLTGKSAITYKSGVAMCPCEDNPKDPCDLARKNDSRANNNNISSQINVIRTKTNDSGKEYGAEQNLSAFPATSDNPYYKPITVRTDDLSNHFTPNFTWNATDGYTVGVNHGHPSDSGPSAADLVNAYYNLKNTELVAAGQTAIDYYKANFTISTVTANETFTVNIKDWDKLETLATAYKTDRTTANNAFDAETIKYVQNIDSNASTVDRTIYAALKLYGDAVTITKLDKGATISSPLKLDSSGNIVKSPCP